MFPPYGPALDPSLRSDREPRARGAGVIAVLGPTNTGKTHLSIERMLAHSSGMIGLPLRLLAREVYQKCVDKVGAAAVALITGEEKIKPATARFYVCTVEAMPQDLDVAYVAIDECQLATDLDRGHVFTDRILNRRGREETMVLGAGTMRGVIERLLPGVSVITRPRMSTLMHAGEHKLARLPRRSAIVAFSAEEVYAIAEFVRRQRGGAAVVMGALSPRTRNAQVELYQSGDVDYMVATDAVGMGLNLDVDHVAFASNRKFDGYQYRLLNPVEMAQIAGRAGRASRNGTFGSTGRCPPLDDELVRRLESHAFDPATILQWRSSDLDFSTVDALLASLGTVPSHPALTRAPLAVDVLVLEQAARDPAIRDSARTPDAVRRLWEVCQVPDYRKVSPAAHAELVTTLYDFLSRRGFIPDDWFGRQVAQTDRTDGDIDTLANRIAHVRTWTFAANRVDWLADPGYWQGETRRIEDRLSDALHERLTQRFVDRRTSVLMRRLRENTMLETEITKAGDVLVEGHPVGHLHGFRFAPDAAAQGPEARALRAAATKVLAGEFDRRATRLSDATDGEFVLASDGTIRWIGEPVGKLIAGDQALHPRVKPIADEALTGSALEAVDRRLTLFVGAHIDKLLGPLIALERAEDVTGIARGIAFQLVESLGVLERQKIAEEMKALDQPARATLRKYGVRFGAYHVYLPALLKPAPRALALQLWALKHGGPDQKGLDDLPGIASSGRTSFPADKEVAKALYRVIGYRVCGERAVRVDILERLADLIRPALAWKPASPGPRPSGAVDGSSFQVTGAMTSLTGASGEDFAAILKSLGYRQDKRPKPVDPPVAVAAPAAPVAEPAASPETGQADEGMPILLDEADPVVEVAVVEAPAEMVVPDPVQAEAVAEAPAGEFPVADVPTTGPEMIEVWRPGGRHDHAPRQHHRKPGDRPRGGQRPTEAADANGAAPEQRHRRPDGERRGPRPDGDRPRFDKPREQREPGSGDRPRFDKPRFDKPRGDRPELADTPREARGEGRPDRPRFDKPRQDRPRFESPPRPEKRERQPDPDSPFAKLLALKEKLEGKS
jgi:ATP-dependent RNA helicase SUPV3L1/SUV3